MDEKYLINELKTKTKWYSILFLPTTIPVLCICPKMVIDEDTAEDLVQDFLYIYEQKDTSLKSLHPQIVLLHPSEI